MKSHNQATGQRQNNGIMAVATFNSKAQHQININRPQTTGKMRVNYTSHGKLFHPKSTRRLALKFNPKKGLS